MIWPSVMSWATPRPATIRIRVAMIGCMPMPATSRPFHAPHRVATASAPATATPIGRRVVAPSTEPPIIQAATAAEIATTAPTEMSMPRIAITRVMPSDTRISGAARLRMSIRLP